jgi:hypothetical protein
MLASLIISLPFILHFFLCFISLILNNYSYYEPPLNFNHPRRFMCAQWNTTEVNFRVRVAFVRVYVCMCVIACMRARVFMSARMRVCR